MPVSQPPMAKYAQGKSNSPDQPIKTKRSRFNQSSTISKTLLTGAFLPKVSVILFI
jgi:hypothetical protein